jgi:hypothetical protein
MADDWNELHDKYYAVAKEDSNKYYISHLILKSLGSLLKKGGCINLGQYAMISNQVFAMVAKEQPDILRRVPRKTAPKPIGTGVIPAPIKGSDGKLYPTIASLPEGVHEIIQFPTFPREKPGESIPVNVPRINNATLLPDVKLVGGRLSNNSSEPANVTGARRRTYTGRRHKKTRHTRRN